MLFICTVKSKQNIVQGKNMNKLIEDEVSDEDSYISVISKYLTETMTKDLSLRNNFIPNMEKKCFDFIYENARKQKKGNCAVIEDKIVFKWIRDYYNDGIAVKDQAKIKEAEEKQRQKNEKLKEKKLKEEKKLLREKKLKEFYSKPMRETKHFKASDFEQLSLF